MTLRTPAPPALETLDELVALLHRCEGVPDVEGPEADPVDVGAHGRQCAALLSDRTPVDPELVAAGLVHDIGHVAWPGCSADHGEVAAALVRPLLGDRVARLVALHVPAKRYLAADDAYAAGLSRGSTTSLARQGGPMTSEERRAFERSEDLDAALTLRRADEDAKVPGAVVPPVEAWRDLLSEVADRASRHAGPGGRG